MAESITFTDSISAGILQVEIKNEAPNLTNNATPRVRIYNQSSNIINLSNLVFYYQFSAEKDFIIKDYYTPNLDIRIGGTIIAPDAVLSIGQSDDLFYGNIIANNITVHQNTKFVFVPLQSQSYFSYK